MAEFELVIVGGGLASARAIKSYRETGGEGTIALFSKDVDPPYHRPPLSKRYLRGEAERADVLVEHEAFYREHDVELFLDTTVTAVLAGQGEVKVEGGERHRYGKLLLATGAWPRRLDVPGSDLEGVLTLRTVVDSTEIRRSGAEARTAVVIGAGFVGMEVAASLRALDVAVTLVHRGRALFELLQSPEIARFLEELYRSNGVTLVLEDEVAEFRGDSRLDAVETAGGRSLQADLAIVGVGVEPVVDFLDGSGIDVDNGIVVNERFETSAPGVWAAGDVASFYDPIFDKQRRIEHWSNSNYQGTEVGKLLAGGEGGYDVVSTFFSEVFGFTFKVFGDPPRGTQALLRGEIEDGKLLGFYLADGRLAGAVLAGQEEKTEDRLKELIRERAQVSDEGALRDPHASLEEAFAGR